MYFAAKFFFPTKSKVRCKSIYFWRYRRLKFELFLKKKKIQVFENLRVVKVLMTSVFFENRIK